MRFTPPVPGPVATPSAGSCATRNSWGNCLVLRRRRQVGVTAAQLRARAGFGAISHLWTQFPHTVLQPAWRATFAGKGLQGWMKINWSYTSTVFGISNSPPASTIPTPQSIQAPDIPDTGGHVAIVHRTLTPPFDTAAYFVVWMGNPRRLGKHYNGGFIGNAAFTLGVPTTQFVDMQFAPWHRQSVRQRYHAWSGFDVPGQVERIDQAGP